MLASECERTQTMDALSDIVFLGLIVAFFGASASLVYFCSRLTETKGRRS